jgi:hypothetical protein
MRCALTARQRRRRCDRVSGRSRPTSMQEAESASANLLEQLGRRWSPRSSSAASASKNVLRLADRVSLRDLRRSSCPCTFTARDSGLSRSPRQVGHGLLSREETSCSTASSAPRWSTGSERHQLVDQALPLHLPASPRPTSSTRSLPLGAVDERCRADFLGSFSHGVVEVDARTRAPARRRDRAVHPSPRVMPEAHTSTAPSRIERVLSGDDEVGVHLGARAEPGLQSVHMPSGLLNEKARRRELGEREAAVVARVQLAHGAVGAAWCGAARR